MAARRRLLVLAQCLPYPLRSGVATRTFNILKQLRFAFDIDLIAFSRLQHQSDSAARDAAQRALFAAADFVAQPTPIPNEHSTPRKIWDHVRSVVSGRPYTYYEYQSEAFADRLRTALRIHSPDLVHLDSLDMHRWIPDLPQVPIACTHHDIDSDLLRRRARQLDRPLLRRYLLLQAARAEDLARVVCPQLALNIMMSALDAQRLQALAPDATTVVVPNGTDTEYFEPNGTRSVAGRVVFVGPTYSFANRDAVEFLLQNIWPRIRAVGHSTALRLIGRNPAADRQRYDAEPGVTTLGEVRDIRPALAEARCCVVPIRVGGGTRVKILDAWAMGKAVVSTSIGCEGLDAVDGENILIRDEPDDFADAVLKVLSDHRLRAHLERNARQTAITTYSWSVVGRRIRSAYENLLGRNHVGRATQHVAPATRKKGRLFASVGPLALGLSLATLSCGAPADSAGVRRSINPPLHEPPGFAQFSDQPWDELTHTTLPILGRLQAFLLRSSKQSTGWNYLRRTSSKDATIIADATAPRSPPNVLEMIFTPDMQPSSEPSVHWIGVPPVREIYTAWWMKLSTNWVNGGAGAGKITFLWTVSGLGQVYTGLYHPCTWPDVSCGAEKYGPPYRIAVNTEWTPYGQQVWYPNAATNWIGLGEWHRVEVYYRWETIPGVSADGIIRWWVDGTLNGNHTNVHYPAAVGFGQFEFAPTVEVPGPAERYMYIDHTYVSIPAIR